MHVRLFNYLLDMPMLLDLFDILPRIIGSLLAVIVARGSG